MRTVKELQQRLKPENSFEARYDITDDDKIHLLYVSPKLNATGYYRMIAPALEINKTSTHKAITTSIEPNNFAETLTETISHLDEKLIAWADYVIFPPLFSDLQYLVQAIRTLQPRAQLVMDFNSPLSRNRAREIHDHRESEAVKHKQPLTNLKGMDIVTVPNLNYQKYLKIQLAEVDVKVEHLPSLISRFAYEEMPPLKRNTSEKLRIGFIKPDAEDLLSLKEVLLEVNASLKEKIQFVCFGKPHSSKEVDKLLKEVDAEIHKTVSFINYFEKLNDLQLDIVLCPKVEGSKNKSQVNYLLNELAVFGIPAIVSAMHPVGKFVEDNETGWIANNSSDWVMLLEALSQDKSAIETVGRNALKWCWATQSYNQKNMDALLDVFI